MNNFRCSYFKKENGDSIIDSIMLYTDLGDRFLSFGNCDIMSYPKEGSLTDHVTNQKVNYISDLYLHSEFLKTYFKTDNVTDEQKTVFFELLKKNFVFITDKTKVFYEENFEVNGN
jgi:hypothetical protein